MTETSAPIGANRTGVETSPKLSEAMVEGAEEGTAHAAADLAPQNALRGAYIEEHDKLGSVPPPGNLKGMAKTGLEMLKGNKANVLIAELADNEGWEMLIGLAKDMGQDNMAAEFQTALQEEARHLALVRSWINEHKHQEAKVGG